MDRDQRLREIRERAEKATPGPWIGIGGSFGIPDKYGHMDLVEQAES